MVPFGFARACIFACEPHSWSYRGITISWPVNATYEGICLSPSSLAIGSGCALPKIEMHEYTEPKEIPINVVMKRLESQT